MVTDQTFERCTAATPVIYHGGLTMTDPEIRHSTLPCVREAGHGGLHVCLPPEGKPTYFR